ncbi:hypothetical protein NIASO_19840 [Niabella soli DSM 19437]|uniref:Uncharacterized protein n=1 Tax=Niabella soli DSM 19437 TaxID=929713 RepID=W0F4Z1_9BACT|nr:hypothetical protein NIASO_19840 [Niabella soli DSM 19437]
MFPSAKYAQLWINSAKATGTGLLTGQQLKP